MERRDDTAAPDDSLDAEKEALLKLLLEEESGKSAAEEAAPSIARVDRSAPLPLSFAQERLWFLEALADDRSLFLLNVVLRIRGPLRRDALAAAVGYVVDRHEVLRTAIDSRDGVLSQSIRPSVPVPLPVEDVAGLPADERAAAARGHLDREAALPFDLAQPPLLRVRLARLADDEHWLGLTLHHIVVDDTSIDVLLRDLAAAYDAFARGGAPALPPLTIQYADYASHQRNRLQGEELAQHLDFWKRTLAGLPGPIELPTDRPRPPIQSLDGRRLSFALDAETSRRLRRLGRELGTTLFTTLLGVFGVLLHRYTGEEDIVVGTPFANRGWAETEGVLGLFINNVVLRADLAGAPSFRDVVDRLRKTVLAAADHQELPFERLVQALNAPRNRSHSPIFQVMFVFLNAPPARLSLPGLEVEAAGSERTTSEFDLSLYLRDSGRGSARDDEPISGWFEYATALFDEATIQRMARHFTILARAIADDAGRPIGALPLMDTAEREQIVSSWNATAMPVPDAPSVHALFEARAQEDPERIAAIVGDAQISYGVLDRRANRVAHRLRALGVAPDAPVALIVERGPEMLAGLLGILKSGGAYMPVDPAYPEQRIRHMLDDSGARIVVAQRSTAALASAFALPTLLLDDDAALAAEPETPLAAITRPEHLAYLIYTSGSTGLPKGVLVEHRNVLNLLAGMARAPGLARDDRLLAVTTISFDIHVLEIFLPLSVGATVVVAGREDAGDGARLLELAQRHRATVMQATPVTWQLMIAAGWRDRLKLRVLCGGEGWPPDLAAALLARCEDLWNVYGPTETTVWSSATRITDPRAPVTIGLPMANTQFHVVGSDRMPLPAGVPGELLIGGHGVTRGYHLRPELTADRFVADSIGASGGRLYRTGDRARRLADGRILLLGRADNQTKIRGYRIELGEIEAALLEQNAVRQAVVIVREDEPGDRRLVAYLLAAGTYRPAAPALRTALRGRLPEHMVPTQFVWLDRYPTTPNGKVDRRALPRPATQPSAATRDTDWSPMERRIAEIFRGVLGIAQVGRQDNFFDLGGHSLLSLKVVDQFAKATGKTLPPGALFQQSVAQIAAMFPEAAVAPDALSAKTPPPERAGEPEKAKSGLFSFFRRGQRDADCNDGGMAQEDLRPSFFDANGRRLFACLHLPVTARARAQAVVICNPLGPEYERGHRALRQLAGRLAGAGFAALRFDYAGTGDSAGSCDDVPVEAWIDDVAAAIAFARRQTRTARVMLVGVRAGALLAALATRGRDDCDGLVLWRPIGGGGPLVAEWERLQSAELAARGLPAAGSEDDTLLGWRMPPHWRSGLGALRMPPLQELSAPILVIDDPAATPNLPRAAGSP